MLDFFALLSILYIGLGVHTLVRVIRSWGSLWDRELTADDRSLAAKAAFYLLVPPAVALHELGHAILVWGSGGKVVRFLYLGYMGVVWPDRSAGPLGDFFIALAGNAVTLAIGAGALLFGLLRPGHPVRNILFVELGRQSLFLVLAFYPLICISFPGDFKTIYDFESTPIASGITAVVHGAILVGGYALWWAKKGRPRAALLCSEQAIPLVEAERRLESDPNDLGAHGLLGRFYAHGGDLEKARAHLAKVVEAQAADGKMLLAYGTVLLAMKDATRAVEVLEQARERLFVPEERRIASQALGEALLRSGQKEKALAAANELRAADPGNDAALMLWARARAAAGEREAVRAEIGAMFDREPDGRRKRVLRLLIDELGR